MWRAIGTRDVRVVAYVARNVVLADWLFTVPAVIAQPVTGVLLAHLMGWPLDSGWIVASAGLYVLVVACWLPVVWLQLKMAPIAEAAVSDGTPLPDRFDRYARRWFWLGWPAFGAILVIIHLMIAKPDLG